MTLNYTACMNWDTFWRKVPWFFKREKEEASGGVVGFGYHFGLALLHFIHVGEHQGKGVFCFFR